MTLLDIMESAPSAPVRAKTRKKGKCEQVAEFFRARPHIWIDGREVERFAGHYGGWSARIREARKRFGIDIKNRIRWVKGANGAYKVSEYIYIPVSGEGQ